MNAGRQGHIRVDIERHRDVQTDLWSSLVGLLAMPSLRASIAYVLSGLLLFTGTGAMALERTDRTDLQQLFEENGLEGTFVLFEVSANGLHVVNAARAEQRFFPASTFKVANSLIALETGVVADEGEIIPYGGGPQPIESWEADMSMRDAIRISNVPVYQELARRVGLDRYEIWLRHQDYGNGQAGDKVDDFWLVGPLAISAMEQVGFLARLAEADLPVSTASQRIVRDILHHETRGNRTLCAKSGWSTAPEPQIAWWVGWIEHGDTVYAFAPNIDVHSPKQAALREPLARAFLDALGVWPSP